MTKPHDNLNNILKREELDAMKNEFEDDESYLSDDDLFRGYFLVSFLFLYM